MCRTESDFDKMTINYIVIQLIEEKKEEKKKIVRGTYLPIDPAIKPNYSMDRKKTVMKAEQKPKSTEVEIETYVTMDDQNENESKIEVQNDEIDFKKRFQFSKNIPNPKPYIEIKNRYYPSKPVF